MIVGLSAAAAEGPPVSIIVLQGVGAVSVGCCCVPQTRGERTMTIAESVVVTILSGMQFPIAEDAC